MPDCVELVRYGWSPGWVKLCCSLPCHATPCQVNQLHNLGCSVSSPSSFFCLAGTVCLFRNLQYVCFKFFFFFDIFFLPAVLEEKEKIPDALRVQESCRQPCATRMTNVVKPLLFTCQVRASPPNRTGTPIANTQTPVLPPSLILGGPSQINQTFI